MKLKNLIVPALLFFVFVVMLCVVPPVKSDPPSARYPETVPGFGAESTLTVASDAAVIVGTLPTGIRSFVAYAASADVNVGNASISTGTSHLYIPHGEFRWFGYFQTPTPTLYFRIRGTATGTTSLLVVPGPEIKKPY